MIRQLTTVIGHFLGVRKGSEPRGSHRYALLKQLIDPGRNVVTARVGKRTNTKVSQIAPIRPG
jgi:hypothetical protein